MSDTALEQALEEVLIEYCIPAHGLMGGADRGDLSSDLATAVRRLYRGHYVVFTEDCWTVEHSMECRESGRMHECSYHKAVANVTDGPPTAAMLGRWRITNIDSEGCPSLERVGP